MDNIRENKDPPTLDDGDDVDGSSSDPAWLEASILASTSDDARAISPDHGLAGDADHRTVLMVAGDVDMRTYVRGCLAHMTSIQVLEAPDVLAIGGIARSMSLDLIVVDVEGDSASTVVDRMLGVRPELATVPVIVITDEEQGSARETIGSGKTSSTLLVKPFNARRLCAEVHRLLDVGPCG